jgi:hypothetical protein
MANEPQMLRLVSEPEPGFTCFMTTSLVFMGADPVTAGLLARNQGVVTGMAQQPIKMSMDDGRLANAAPDVPFTYTIGDAVAFAGGAVVPIKLLCKLRVDTKA